MDTTALGQSVHGDTQASARKRGALMKRVAWMLALVLLALGHEALEPVTNTRVRLDACVAAYDHGSSAASAEAHAAQSEDTYDREQRLNETVLACSVQP
jgi:hypothetical protein